MSRCLVSMIDLHSDTSHCYLDNSSAGSVSLSLLQVVEPLVTAAHVLTVSGLQASTSYNCSVISTSYSSSSEPAHISITTSGDWPSHQLNPIMHCCTSVTFTLRLCRVRFQHTAVSVCNDVNSVCVCVQCLRWTRVWQRSPLWRFSAFCWSVCWFFCCWCYERNTWS